ncbi:MAG: hypothetical protein KDC61_15435 [Saprospiraceae bacterium]|nr:hypothetical protein [Saprospiraceae bacterium]MCB9353685.1 hypothetical protein [Lewinellaceae bacterium]
MKPLLKSSLICLLLSIGVALMYTACNLRENPCKQCTPVSPEFSVTPDGLYVKPPELPDITGSVLTVTNLADSSLVMYDTIEPGGYRIVPVNLDSVSINVQLEYLTPGSVDSKTSGPKYCPGNANFFPPLGIIVMDVVIYHDDHEKACTPPDCGNIGYGVQLSDTTNVSYHDDQPGHSPIIVVGGVKIYSEIDIGRNIWKVWYCDLNVDTIYKEPITPRGELLHFTKTDGSEFTIKASYDYGQPNPFKLEIYSASNYFIGYCTGSDHQ